MYPISENQLKIPDVKYNNGFGRVLSEYSLTALK
jgi:hypothetical protein